MSPLIALPMGALTYLMLSAVQLGRSRPRRIAHEAGHGLLMWYCPYFASVERVTISTNLISYDGITEARNYKGPGLPLALIALGGMAGEVVALGNYKIEGAKGDIRHAREILPAHLLGAGLEQAKIEIRRRRPAFDRLCAALDAKDVLDKAALTAVLGPRPTRPGARTSAIASAALSD